MKRLLIISIALLAFASCKKDDPVPAVENWCLEFEDQFDSINLDYWTPTVAPDGTDYTYRTDRPENVRAENGFLILELHKENYEGYGYTGADLLSPPIQPYCKIECSARLPSANIAWPVFWLLGDYGPYGAWPNCGEIDIMEYWGYQYPNVYTNLHTKASNYKNGKNRNKHSISQEILDVTDQFHTYGMEWYSDRLEFFLDGNHYWTYNKLGDSWRKWPYDIPMKIVFQMYATPDYEGDDSDLPDDFEVDYVRIYRACP